MSPETAGTTSAETIILIHGLWMTPLSWEHWIDRYTARGFDVIAPAWPGMEGGVESLREDPSPIAGLSVDKVVCHYAEIIRKLDPPPIMIGHSFGGTFVQLLLDRGYGAAGVGVDSSTIKGVLPLPLSTLRATFPVLDNPLNHNRAVPLTAKQFHYAFTNTLTEEESQKVYDRYHVPGCGRILFEGAFGNFNPDAPTRVDTRNNDRAPLLLIAGGKDHIIPTNVTKSNFGLYEHSEAITGYKEYPDRSHFTVGQEGWEEVADYALDWAINPTSGWPRSFRFRRSGTGG